MLERMKSLIASMLLWIGANTNYNVDLPHPDIKLLPQQEMEHIYSQGMEMSSHLHGFYDTKKDIIYLPDTFELHDPWQQGVLLHELLHYVQDQNEAKFQCKNDMETEAWPLQKKFLLEYHDYDWEYDKFWFSMVSKCFFSY